MSGTDTLLYFQGQFATVGEMISNHRLNLGGIDYSFESVLHEEEGAIYLLVKPHTPHFKKGTDTKTAHYFSLRVFIPPQNLQERPKSKQLAWLEKHSKKANQDAQYKNKLQNRKYYSEKSKKTPLNNTTQVRLKNHERKVAQKSQPNIRLVQHLSTGYLEPYKGYPLYFNNRVVYSLQLLHEQNTFQYDGDTWKFLNILGEGQESLIFKVQNLSTCKHHALKIFKTLPGILELEDDEWSPNDLYEFARKEHQFLQQMGYESKVFGSACITELFRGTTYSELVLTPGYANLPNSLKLKIVIDIFERVQKMHQQGIAHRDLDPTNIMIDFTINSKTISLETMLTLTQKELSSVIPHVHIIDFGQATFDLMEKATHKGSSVNVRNLTRPKDRKNKAYSPEAYLEDIFKVLKFLIGFWSPDDHLWHQFLDQNSDLSYLKEDSVVFERFKQQCLSTRQEMPSVLAKQLPNKNLYRQDMTQAIRKHYQELLLQSIRATEHEPYQDVQDAHNKLIPFIQFLKLLLCQQQTHELSIENKWFIKLGRQQALKKNLNTLLNNLGNPGVFLVHLESAIKSFTPKTQGTPSGIIQKDMKKICQPIQAIANQCKQLDQQTQPHTKSCSNIKVGLSIFSIIALSLITIDILLPLKGTLFLTPSSTLTSFGLTNMILWPLIILSLTALCYAFCCSKNKQRSVQQSNQAIYKVFNSSLKPAPKDKFDQSKKANEMAKPQTTIESINNAVKLLSL